MLMLINLPIVIWMLYTYFREIPADPRSGAHGRRPLWGEIVYVLTPMAVPGIASTAAAQHHPGLERKLLDDPAHHHERRPAHRLHRQFSSPQGLFWAKLSAASTMAIAPILIIGWLSQKQLVRGLTFGAVKGPEILGTWAPIQLRDVNKSFGRPTSSRKINLDASRTASSSSSSEAVGMRQVPCSAHRRAGGHDLGPYPDRRQDVTDAPPAQRKPRDGLPVPRSTRMTVAKNIAFGLKMAGGRRR